MLQLRLSRTLRLQRRPVTSISRAELLWSSAPSSAVQASALGAFQEGLWGDVEEPAVACYLLVEMSVRMMSLSCKHSQECLLWGPAFLVKLVVSGIPLGVRELAKSGSWRGWLPPSALVQWSYWGYPVLWYNCDLSDLSPQREEQCKWLIRKKLYVVLKSEMCWVVAEVEGWQPEIIDSACTSLKDSVLKCFQLSFFQLLYLNSRKNSTNFTPGSSESCCVWSTLGFECTM